MSEKVPYQTTKKGLAVDQALLPANYGKPAPGLTAGCITQRDNIVAIEACAIRVLGSDEEPGVNASHLPGYISETIADHERSTTVAPAPKAAGANDISRLLEAF